MKNIIKLIGKLLLLFLSTTICSIIVVNIFMCFGISYVEPANVVFIASLTSTLLVSTVHLIRKKN